MSRNSSCYMLEIIISRLFLFDWFGWLFLVLFLLIGLQKKKKNKENTHISIMVHQEPGMLVTLSITQLLLKAMLICAKQV